MGMAKAMDQNVEMVVQKLQDQMAVTFGKNVSQELIFALAKELGLVEGRRGRAVGGTYTTPLGMEMLSEK